MTRPSPSMVVALAALFVALGGTAYAATKLPKNAVGTAQLKKNAVTGAKIRKNAVAGSDVKESSLGKVPKAVRADAAARADSATSASSATTGASASTATTAANASKLGGLHQSAFLRAGAIHRFGGLTATHGEVGKVVATLAGVRFTISCQADFAEWGVIGPPGGNSVMFSSNGEQGTPVGSGNFLTAQNDKLSSADFAILTRTGVRIHGVLSAAEDPFGASGCRFGGFALVDG